MHVLVIGAAGMVGRKLTARLAAEGALGGRPVNALTLLDVVPPEKPAGFTGKVETRAADLSTPGEAARAVAG
ncbi:MAG TPA: NAD-dependent epimerase, partial [Acetobacteraceae bacterium]|nr:NAD-dependent epimerase [Acetobacteraceae bacterium]